MKPTQASEIPVEISEDFEIPGMIPFDFTVEICSENPVDFEVKIRSIFRSDSD